MSSIVDSNIPSTTTSTSGDSRATILGPEEASTFGPDLAEFQRISAFVALVRETAATVGTSPAPVYERLLLDPPEEIVVPEGFNADPLEQLLIRLGGVPGIHHHVAKVERDGVRVDASELLPDVLKALDLYGYSGSAASEVLPCYAASLVISCPSALPHLGTATIGAEIVERLFTELKPNETPQHGDVAIIYEGMRLFLGTGEICASAKHAVAFETPDAVWSKNNSGVDNPLFLRMFDEVCKEWNRDGCSTFTIIRYFRPPREVTSLALEQKNDSEPMTLAIPSLDPRLQPLATALDDRSSTPESVKGLMDQLRGYEGVDLLPLLRTYLLGPSASAPSESPEGEKISAARSLFTSQRTREHGIGELRIRDLFDVQSVETPLRGKLAELEHNPSSSLVREFINEQSAEFAIAGIYAARFLPPEERAALVLDKVGALNDAYRYPALIAITDVRDPRVDHALRSALANASADEDRPRILSVIRRRSALGIAELEEPTGDAASRALAVPFLQRFSGNPLFINIDVLRRPDVPVETVRQYLDSPVGTFSEAGAHFLSTLEPEERLVRAGSMLLSKNLSVRIIALRDLAVLGGPDAKQLVEHSMSEQPDPLFRELAHLLFGV